MCARVRVCACVCVCVCVCVYIGGRVHTASSMHECICVCAGACVCTARFMSDIFNISCQKSNQDRAHVQACACLQSFVLCTRAI